MTANQLVALKLRHLRERDGLTQEQAAEKLEPLLGRRWSQASFSAAETSVESSRIRQFDANELLAFAIVFNVPVGYFFLPPDAEETVTAGGPEEVDAVTLIRSAGIGLVNPETIEQLKRVDEQLQNMTQMVQLFREITMPDLVVQVVDQDTRSKGRQGSSSKTKGGRHGKTS